MNLTAILSLIIIERTVSPKGSSEQLLLPHKRAEVKKPVIEALGEAESVVYAEVRRRSQLCIKETDDTLFGKFSSDTPNLSQVPVGGSSALVTGALHKSAAESKKKPLLPPKLQKTKCPGELLIRSLQSPDCVHKSTLF